MCDTANSKSEHVSLLSFFDLARKRPSFYFGCVMKHNASRGTVRREGFVRVCMCVCACFMCLVTNGKFCCERFIKQSLGKKINFSSPFKTTPRERFISLMLVFCCLNNRQPVIIFLIVRDNTDSLQCIVLVRADGTGLNQRAPPRLCRARTLIEARFAASRLRCLSRYLAFW